MTDNDKRREPKGSPKKYDYTSTKRGQKRTALDNAWAYKVSGGKYKTLRNLMRAIHAGEYALAEAQPTPLAQDGGSRPAKLVDDLDVPEGLRSAAKVFVKEYRKVFNVNS